jgi:uroporphyrinogen-III decarboxylase
MSQNEGFGWFVGVAEATLPYLSGIDLDEFYLNPRSCARAIRVGRKRVRELFGDEIALPAVSCPPLSYGHVACLGGKVVFLHDSEPYVRTAYQNLDDAIEALRRARSFEDNDLFRHYLRIHEYLKQEFPQDDVKFTGFSWEGPVTSAVLLRGKDFCVDLYREPGKAKAFLELLTDSITSFVRLQRRMNMEPEINPDSTDLADDFSSLIHPKMWEEFVIPYWNQYYAGLTSGRRNLHCENLSPEHLKYLKMARVSHYDPSVSRKLSPRTIRKETDIAFTWRLPSFELLFMSRAEIRDWVMRARKEGATHVHMYIERAICDGGNPAKVITFIETAKELAAQSGKSVDCYNRELNYSGEG